MNREQDLVYRIWAVLVFGAGSSKLAELSERYPSPSQLYMALCQDEAERVMLTPQRLQMADSISPDNAKRIIEDCAKRDIRIVSLSDDSYPDKLRTIYAPPQVLFYIGSISTLNRHRSLGVVGTRKPSEYSRQVTSAVVSAAAKHEIDIISGFAEGIDICSQLTALRCGAWTYSVLGCGVDTIYPKSNERYREAVAGHGALISEFLPGTEPKPQYFPQRNRILSGLSDAIAVIEAGATSGSLNTASHAAVQGRTVFTVPPADLFDKRYAGNIALLRDGTVPLMGTTDLLDEFGTDTKEDRDDKAYNKAKPAAVTPEEDRKTENKTTII